MTILTALSIVACESQKRNSQNVTGVNGGFVRLENFDSKYVASRNVDIWLPDGYNNNETYAVLYMHDGQMLFDPSDNEDNTEWGVDEKLSKLIEERKIDPCIVVGVWNSGLGRHSDYFPKKPFESLSTY